MGLLSALLVYEVPDPSEAPSSPTRGLHMLHATGNDIRKTSGCLLVGFRCQ
jgi:hypothetical protein